MAEGYSSFRNHLEHYLEQDAKRREQEAEEKLKEFCREKGITYIPEGMTGRQALVERFGVYTIRKENEEKAQEEKERAERIEAQKQEHIRECMRQFRLQVPQRYKDAKLSDFKDSPQKTAIMNGSCALILGNNSTGKTRFIWALCEYWASKGESFIIVKAQKLLADIKDHDKGKYQYIETFKKYKHCMIDEIDKIFGSTADYVYLNYFVDMFYENMQQLIVAGNGDTHSFIETLGQSIFARLAGEGGQAIMFRGKDWRFPATEQKNG